MRATALVTLLCALLCTGGCTRGADAHTARGNLHARRGELALAEQEYRAACERTESARPRELLGHVLVEQGKRPEARAAYEAALKADARAVEAQVGIARIALEEGLLDESIQRLDAALETSPENLYGLLSRANALLRRSGEGDLQRALADAQRAGSLEGSNAQAQYVLGNVLLALKDFPAADGAFTRVRELLPEAPLAFYGWARLAAAQNDFAVVSANLQQARLRAKDAWRPDQVLADPAFGNFKDSPAFVSAVTGSR